MNWLRRVWKWIVGGIVGLALLGLWIGCAISLYYVQETVGKVDGTMTSIKTTVENDAMVNNQILTAVNGLSTKAESETATNRIVTAIEGLKPQPTPAGTPGRMPSVAMATAASPPAIVPECAISDLLEMLVDADPKIASKAAQQLIWQRGEDEVVRKIFLAYCSGDSRMKQKTRWLLSSRMDEQTQKWMDKTLANPGSDPRVMIAIEEFKSFENSNDAQIAKLQTQANLDKTERDALQKVWSNGRTEDRKYLDDNLKAVNDRISAIEAEIKKVQRVQAQPQPQPTPAPAPSPAATSAMMPGAAVIEDPPARVLSYNSAMPSYYRAPVTRNPRYCGYR